MNNNINNNEYDEFDDLLENLDDDRQVDISRRHAGPIDVRRGRTPTTMGRGRGGFGRGGNFHHGGGMNRGGGHGWNRRPIVRPIVMPVRPIMPLVDSYILAVFATRLGAELFLTNLRMAGVPSSIVGYNRGGVLGMASAVRVRYRDRHLAERILNSGRYVDFIGWF